MFHPHTSAAAKWFSDIQQATSYEELGDDYPFDRTSLYVKEAMQRIMYGEFSNMCNGLDTSRAACGQPLLGGRQLVWLMYQKFRTSKVSTSLVTTHTFLQLQLRNDNIKQYMNQWFQLLA